MNANIGILEKIYEKIKELNRQNELLKQKYQNDEKYARIHKRLMQNSELSKSKIQVFEALSDVKKETDEKVLNRNSILENEDYFRRLMMTTVIHQFKNQHNINLNPNATKEISALVSNEYINEFNGGVSW